MKTKTILWAALSLLAFSLLGMGCGDDEETTDDNCTAFCEKVNQCTGGEEDCQTLCENEEYVNSKQAVYCCVDTYDECDDISQCILITDGSGCDELPSGDDDDDDDTTTDDDDDNTTDDDDDDDDSDPVYVCLPSSDGSSEACDFNQGVCEPAQNYSSAEEYSPCCEDLDCACSEDSGECFYDACDEDGHCDSYCPAGTDPDCD